MMSSDMESRAIRLERIGGLDEKDLREIYQCLGKSPGENVVEAVFTPPGRDFAVVIFTDEKFVAKAVQRDHGDIEVSQPHTQVFSGVSATIHENIQQAIGSSTVWKIVLKELEMQYGVDIQSLVIRGSWLQVEMCMLTLRKIYNECRGHDVGATGTRKDTTGGNPETDSEERDLGTTGEVRKSFPTTTEEGTSYGTADIESGEEPIYVYHGNRHGATAQDSCHTGEPRAETVAGKTYQVASTRIHVYMGDITKLMVDVIVNAANEHLNHGAGVAAAIARAAGPELKLDCDRYTQEYGNIPTGCGVMTTSGRLPCRGVFHVVGPMWSRYEDNNYCLTLLELTFTNCLRGAASNYCSSVAIPAVSSGVFGVPIHYVAEVMCDAVTKFCRDEGRHSSLKDIHLVDINATMVKLVQKNFDQVTKSESHIQTPAGIASVSSGVAGSIWKGLVDVAGATTTESVTEDGPCSHDAEDDWKNRSSSTSGFSDTDKKKGSVVMPQKELALEEGRVGSCSCDTPKERSDDGEKQRRSSATSSVREHSKKRGDTSASERENRRDDDKGTFAAKDHKMKSYAAVAQGGATRPAKNEGPDKVAGEHSGAAAAKGDSSEKDDECPICMDKFDHPKVLPLCKHKFCTACIDRSFKLKTECPVCRMVYGKLQGTQPKNGKMDANISSVHLPGYRCDTIVIHYYFPDGKQTKEHPHPGQPYRGAIRTAYLPSNKDGHKILNHLKKAFDQRLTFTVGRSVTTGVDDCVTWNDIHHKTSQDGGPDNYGYPDEGYLQRVAQDLAAKGIK